MLWILDQRWRLGRIRPIWGVGQRLPDLAGFIKGRHVQRLGQPRAKAILLAESVAGGGVIAKGKAIKCFRPLILIENTLEKVKMLTPMVRGVA